MSGSISAGLVNHLRFRLGLSGNLRGRKATGTKRGRPPQRVRIRTKGSAPATTRRRSSEPMELEVGIGRIDKLQPGEGVHLVARGEREAPALQHAEHFVQQRIVGPSDAGPPVRLARASRQLAGHIE